MDLTEPEPVVYRDEITAYLFRVSDIAEDVSAIRELLEGEDNGEEEAL